MDILIDASKEMFEAGDLDGAWKGIDDAYYGYYETTGFERVAMGYISGSRKTEMELQFSSAKAVAKKNGSYEDFAKEADTLSAMLREDANKLDGVSSDSGDSSDTTTSSTSTSAATATFIACFSIMLREGFEAILIVGAIIAYLQKSAGNDRAKKRKAAVPVYIGSVVGIVASFILAWLLDAIKLANSASQEIIEGVTALTAVAVLYYVSNWMLSKSETDAWTAYIKSKAQRSSEKGSVFALAFTAFLAVFREGAEVVLFFQPMLSEDNISSVWMGFAIGCICLVFVYLAIHLLSVRIPIKPFFTATSVLMFVMSISFLGAGIKELIEGNVITPTYPEWLSWIPTNDFLDVLGIYGCLETLIPQLILLVITVVIFVVQTKKNRAIHAKAEAERAAAEEIRIEREKKAEDIGFRKRVAEIYKELSDKGADAVLLALAEEEKALSVEAAADKAE
jgi:high-affinity iron transporter